MTGYKTEREKLDEFVKEKLSKKDFKKFEELLEDFETDVRYLALTDE